MENNDKTQNSCNKNNVKESESKFGENKSEREESFTSELKNVLKTSSSSSYDEDDVDISRNNNNDDNVYEEIDDSQSKRPPRYTVFVINQGDHVIGKGTDHLVRGGHLGDDRADHLNVNRGGHLKNNMTDHLNDNRADQLNSKKNDHYDNKGTDQWNGNRVDHLDSKGTDHLSTKNGTDHSNVSTNAQHDGKQVDEVKTQSAMVNFLTYPMRKIVEWNFSRKMKKSTKNKNGGDSVEEKIKMESKKESQIWKKWRHFTEHTTLHGVKYVFSRGSHRLRKLIWSICVTTCICLFAYQAIERTLIYFQYPSNVNVQIIYAKTIEFPAVTICNYNKHRLTSVVDKGLYEFISQVYKLENDKPQLQPNQKRGQGNQLEMTFNPELYPPGVSIYNQNATEFTLTTSHQKLDFIISCTWHGRNCNVDNNFTISLTDFGVCYTFNGDLHNRLNVVRSGARSGLSVMLNIELYEYMIGPDHESGVKLLLHDPREIPQVRDLGFAVSPGSHVLVGVKKQLIENLEAPYGTCLKNSTTRSACLSTCISNDVFSRCGCRDLHMLPPTKYKDQMCSFATLFLCVRGNSASPGKFVNTECECSSPCSITNYDPTLSYATISQVDFETLIDRGQPINVSRIRVSYQKARSTFARIDNIASSNNARMIDKVLRATSNFKNSITSSCRKMDPQGRTSISYVRNYTALSSDLALTNHSFNVKIPLFTTTQPDFSHWVTLIYDAHYGLSDFFDLSDNLSSSRLILKLQICSKAEIETERQQNEKSMHAETCADDDPEQKTYLFYRKLVLKKWEVFANNSYEMLLQSDEKYNETVSMLFEGTSVDWQTNTSHQECVRLLKDTKSFWIPLLKDIIEVQVPMYLNSTNWTEKLTIARNIYNFYQLNSYSNVSITVQKYIPCHWFLKNEWFNKNYNFFVNYMNAALQSHLTLTSVEISVHSRAFESLESIEKLAQPITSILRNFLSNENNVTKTDIYMLFETEKIKSLETTLVLQMQSFLSDLQQLLTKIIDTQNHVSGFFRNAFLLVVPPLNNVQIEKLELVKVARALSEVETNARLSHLLSILNSNMSTAVVGIVEILFDRYKEAVQSVQSSIVRSSREFDVCVGELKKNLEQYVAKGYLDESFIKENFIKLDIFYKELSYEHIQQQVSFQSLSLFSEIGGFLGLLLGASVLTMFEFIDFFIMLILGYTRKSRQKSN